VRLVFKRRSGGRLQQNSPAAARAGFSLVEVVAAIVILSFGVLGLASSSAFIAKQMTGGATHVRGAMAAQSRMELLRSQPCGTLSSGTETILNIQERWEVTAGQNGTRIINVWIMLPRRTTAEQYTSISAC
jgi:prepilin-type N-terminal cleavage/methylation domain-containing protein